MRRATLQLALLAVLLVALLAAATSTPTSPSLAETESTFIDRLRKAGRKFLALVSGGKSNKNADTDATTGATTTSASRPPSAVERGVILGAKNLERAPIEADNTRVASSNAHVNVNNANAANTNADADASLEAALLSPTGAPATTAATAGGSTNDPKCTMAARRAGTLERAVCVEQAKVHAENAMAFFGVHSSWLPTVLSILDHESALIPDNENTGSGAMGIGQWMPQFETAPRVELLAELEAASSDATKSAVPGFTSILQHARSKCSTPTVQDGRGTVRDTRLANQKTNGECYFNAQFGVWIMVWKQLRNARRCGGHDLAQPLTTLDAAKTATTQLYICWNSGPGNYARIRRAQTESPNDPNSHEAVNCDGCPAWLKVRPTQTLKPAAEKLPNYWTTYGPGSN